MTTDTCRLVGLYCVCLSLLLCVSVSVCRPRTIKQPVLCCTRTMTLTIKQPEDENDEDDRCRLRATFQLKMSSPIICTRDDWLFLLDLIEPNRGVGWFVPPILPPPPPPPPPTPPSTPPPRDAPPDVDTPAKRRRTE